MVPSLPNRSPNIEPAEREAALGVSPRLNGCRQVIRSLPVQPASSAASAGSRTVHRPDSCDRLSSKSSRTTKSASAGHGADAGTSPLTTVITRSDWSLLTRAAIWAARVDLPMPPIP